MIPINFRKWKTPPEIIRHFLNILCRLTCAPSLDHLREEWGPGAQLRGGALVDESSQILAVRHYFARLPKGQPDHSGRVKGVGWLGSKCGSAWIVLNPRGTPSLRSASHKTRNGTGLSEPTPSSGSTPSSYNHARPTSLLAINLHSSPREKPASRDCKRCWR